MAPAIDELGAEEIWKEPVDRILARLAATAAGLASAEVQSRLETFGPNDAAVVKRSPLWLQFISRFRNPLVIILLVASGLSAATIVASVRKGRITLQRILTYALRSLVHKSRQVLFLGFGLILTKHAILTPMLMVISMITGDFLAMSSTTDNVRPSRMPNSWRIDSLTIVGVVLGLFDLAFCRRSVDVWFAGNAPRHRYTPHHDARHARTKRSGRFLCRPRAQTSLVFAT